MLSLPAARRNLLVLFVCQALNNTGLTLMIAVSALTGKMLAEDDALATLPLGLQFTALMLTTFPASYLMRRAGRRVGFTIGTTATLTGGLVMMQAVLAANFPVFCFGNALVGVGAAFAQFYRFAAADAADDRTRGKAISLVLAGGVVAAIAGPLLAGWSRLAFPVAPYAGCFAVLAGLAFAAICMVQFLRLAQPTAAERHEHARPMGEILRQPVLIVALLGGMIGYGVMSLVMTSTPLAMVGHHHAENDAFFVIQWHVLGMFVPSFFTGHLIARFGVLQVMLAGGLLLAACVGVNLTGTGLAQFWTALLLLGVGWNFLYIGSSTLLTQAYRPAERAGVQALNDFMIGVAIAVASFSSGALHSHFGWVAVNLGVAPLILLALVAALRLMQHQRRTVAVG